MRKILFLLACIILGGCTQKSLENNNTITINLDEDYQLQRDDVKIIALSKHKMYTIISNQNHLSSNLKHQMLDEIMLNEKDQWIQVSKKIKVNNKVTPIINFYLLVNKEKDWNIKECFYVNIEHSDFVGKLFYHVQDNQTIYFDINGDFVEGEQIIDSSFNSCEVGEKEEQYFDVKEAKKYKNSYVCLNGTIHL